MQHRNAPLTPQGRRRLVALVEDDGLTFEAAAAASNVSRSTAHEWVWRWRRAGEERRADLSCLEDRSSRPHHSPRMLSDEDHERCCEVRRRTGWGPRLVASEVGIPHATVHRALRRRGCSRRPRAPREKVVRYEWPCPGNLLHVDTKRHARFVEPGHAVTGTVYLFGETGLRGFVDATDPRPCEIRRIPFQGMFHGVRLDNGNVTTQGSSVTQCPPQPADAIRPASVLRPAASSAAPRSATVWGSESERPVSSSTRRRR